MADIGRSLDEIDSKVKKLNDTLKLSTEQTINESEDSYLFLLNKIIGEN